MQEIAPGIWYWRARHERIHIDVSSYLLEDRVVLDPMIPAEGIEWFDSHGPPEHVLLTNRHHDRHCWRLRDAYGCTVHCVSSGAYELEGRGPVQTFEFGDRLPGGAVAYEVDAICPDETALHFPSHRALACADGVVCLPGRDELTFVPDELMEEPQRTKAALKESYGRLLELDFDLLLLAHGAPVTSGAKDRLRAFVES